MTRPRVAAAIGIGLLVGLVVWIVFVAIPRWTAPAPSEPPPAAAAPPEPAPKIRAHLFYVAEDGLRLRSVDREVIFGQGTSEQARHLVEALLEPPPEPLLRALPAGTTLRTLFLSPQGVAFVDLSGEAARGGSGALDELFAVYSLVNTLADNLPAVTAVQILVNGREVETLAGHVDLRQPLVKNLRWTESPAAAPAQ